MIIACPACATRYAVPDSAIGAEGRTVRCAKCRHSWFQDGPSLAASAPQIPETKGIAAIPAPRPDQPSERAKGAPPSVSPATTTPPRANMATEPENRAAHAEAAPSTRILPEAPSRFAHEPPFRPRRNPARRATMAAAAFAVFALGVVGLVSIYGLPDWAPFSAHATFGANQPDLTLDFPPNRQDRRTLPDGTQFFGVSGTITNVGKERRAVPDLLILLRNDHNHVVYSWQVTPSKHVLAPGETESILEAVTDIPRSAKFAEIGWKPG